MNNLTKEKDNLQENFITPILIINVKNNPELQMKIISMQQTIAHYFKNNISEKTVQCEIQHHLTSLFNYLELMLFGDNLKTHAEYTDHVNGLINALLDTFVSKENTCLDPVDYALGHNHALTKKIINKYINFEIMRTPSEMVELSYTYLLGVLENLYKQVNQENKDILEYFFKIADRLREEFKIAADNISILQHTPNPHNFTEPNFEVKSTSMKRISEILKSVNLSELFNSLNNISNITSPSELTNESSSITSVSPMTNVSSSTASEDPSFASEDPSYASEVWSNEDSNSRSSNLSSPINTAVNTVVNFLWDVFQSMNDLINSEYGSVVVTVLFMLFTVVIAYIAVPFIKGQQIRNPPRRKSIGRRQITE